MSTDRTTNTGGKNNTLDITRPMDIMTAPIRDLMDAEGRLSLLDRLDLVMRLKRGEIYKTVRDKRLYTQQGYETFDDWVRYAESHKGGTLQKVKILIALYEVFVEMLALDPMLMQEEGITYTALRLILPYVRMGWDTNTGERTIVNKDDVMEYLNMARVLSSEELKGYMDATARPDANRSMIKFERIDLVGDIAMIHAVGIDDLTGPRDAGIWHLTTRCYKAVKEALRKDGRLILDPDVEPSMRKGGTPDKRSGRRG